MLNTMEVNLHVSGIQSIPELIYNFYRNCGHTHIQASTCTLINSFKFLLFHDINSNRRDWVKRRVARHLTSITSIEAAAEPFRPDVIKLYWLDPHSTYVSFSFLSEVCWCETFRWRSVVTFKCGNTSPRHPVSKLRRKARGAKVPSIDT